VTDAAGLGIGGVLQVWRDDIWEVAVFYSRQLKGAEQRYSATKLEALAVAATIEHFNYYLYEKQFVVYTDHKPLLSPRLKRFAFKLQHWMIQIEYLTGDSNTFAKALSREERKRTSENGPDVHLVVGDVAAQPPLEEEREKEEGE